MPSLPSGWLPMREWAVALALALLPICVRLACYPDYPGADDAFIHAALIENLHARGTLNVGPGPHVNMTTSPLFTASFALLRFATADVMKLGMSLSGAAVVMAVLLTYVVARRSGGSQAAATLAAGLAATNIHLWRWAGTFMEVSFVYLWVVVGYWLLINMTPRSRVTVIAAYGVFVGAGVTLRPELGLLLPAVLLHDGLGRRTLSAKHWAWLTLGCGCVLGLWMAAAYGLTGRCVATTYAAKTAEGVRLWNPGVAHAAAAVAVSGLPGLWALAGVAAVVARMRGIRKSTRSLRSSAMPWLLPLLAIAFYYVKTDRLQSPARYLLPFLALLPLLAVPLLDGLRAQMARGAVMTASLVLVLQLAVAGYLNGARVAPVLRDMRSQYVATMTEAADRLLTVAAQEETTLVVVDIGVVSWRVAGRRRIADAGGLLSPELAGLDMAEQIDRSGASLVLVSLGGAEPLEEAGRFRLESVWQRSFRSHSVGHPDRTFVARLYRVH